MVCGCDERGHSLQQALALGVGEPGQGGLHQGWLEDALLVIEERQALKVACLEEIAFGLGYIDEARLLALAKPMEKNEYGRYLLRVAAEKR